MRLIIYFLVILLVTASCASNKTSLVSYLCEDDLPGLYSLSTPAGTIIIKGRVRIEVPEYRIRGACSIDYSPKGLLRIDFHHSSLFGAHSENATIHATSDKLIIYNHEQDRYSPTDSTLALLRESLGLDLDPDVIIYALLFCAPACSEMDGVRLDGSGDSWELEGVWRGHPVMITGDREHGVSRFQLCSNDGTICYTIRYYYGNTHRYPERITVNRDHGSERLSLEINDVHVKGGSSSTNGEDSVERATHGELLRFGGVSL